MMTSDKNENDERLETFDLDGIVTLETMPACPICGGLITDVAESSYGVIDDGSLINFCLIHLECGEKL